MKKHIQKILNRSGKEKCDICHNEEILEIHHINGREIPNANKKWNLTNICSNCHTKIHMSEIVLEQWFITSEGRALLWHKKDEESITDRKANSFLIPRKY